MLKLIGLEKAYFRAQSEQPHEFEWSSAKVDGHFSINEWPNDENRTLKSKKKNTGPEISRS